MSTATASLRPRLIILALCASSPAALFAQAATKSGDSGTLDEVIVTAERRATDEQKVAASVIAFSGETLMERGISDLDDLQTAVPSMSFQDLGNVRFLNIRGIGIAEGAPNQSVGVATHVDGTVVAREFSINDSFFDVAGVEVLRGPQGTYSGQNAEGGAVFITTVKPRIGDTDGFVTGTFASYSRRQVGLGQNIPLGDKLAARISGEMETRGSYYTNVGPRSTALPNDNPNQPGNVSRYLGRAQLLYTPTENVEARFIWQFSDNRSDGLPIKALNAQAFDADNLVDPWKLTYDFESRRDTKYDRYTLTVDWKITDGVAMRVAETYQNLSQVYNSDNDTTSPLVSSVPQAAGSIVIQDHYHTGEVDLLSTGDGPWQWTTGFTYLDYQQDGSVFNTSYTTVPNFNVGGLNIFVDTVRRNQSVFGEIGYRVSPQLELKAGVRYNRDQAGFRPNSYVAPVGGRSLSLGPVIPLGASELTKLNSTTGRLLVNWTPADNQLVYATASKGYKPGGRTPFNLEYGSEYVKNYELGWKATLLGDRLRTSVAAFHMDYQNYQATIATDPNNPTSAVTRNVDGTTIDGIEGQLSAISGNWHFDGSFSYLDAKYGNLALFAPADTYGPVAAGSPAIAINLKGRRVSYAPKYSANASIGYEIATAQGKWTPSVRANYVDEQWVSFLQARYNLLPSRTLVDVRLAYEPEIAGLRTEAFLTNALNKRYASTLGSGAGNGFYGNYMLGAPREFGVSITYRY